MKNWTVYTDDELTGYTHPMTNGNNGIARRCIVARSKTTGLGWFIFIAAERGDSYAMAGLQDVNGQYMIYPTLNIALYQAAQELELTQ